MLQVKFLLVGLLLAAAFVGYLWLDGLPPIAPVQLPSTTDNLTVEAEQGSEAQREARSLGGQVAVPELAGSGAAEAEPLPVVLPALNDSDSWLRDRLASTALPWLAETELLRTSATVLANAARGEVPRKFVEFLAPKSPFTVSSKKGQLTANAASHARYSSFVASLTAVEPAYAAELFGLVEPLLSEALRELGGDADGNVASPRALAAAALEIALATPTEGVADAALVQPKVIYKYADPALEELAPLQKQLLRMGPENVSTLRPWLEAFGMALAPEASSLD